MVLMKASWAEASARIRILGLGCTTWAGRENSFMVMLWFTTWTIRSCRVITWRPKSNGWPKQSGQAKRDANLASNNTFEPVVHPLPAQAVAGRRASRTSSSVESGRCWVWRSAHQDHQAALSRITTGSLGFSRIGSLPMRRCMLRLKIRLEIKRSRMDGSGWKPQDSSAKRRERDVKTTRCRGGSRPNQSPPKRQWPSDWRLGVEMEIIPPGFKIRKHS